MKLSGREEVQSAWESLTNLEKEKLDQSYQAVLDGLRADGSEPANISVLESLSRYAEDIGWESTNTAFEDFLEIIEN